MSRELSLALVQHDAAKTVDDFGRDLRLLTRQYPATSLFVFPEQHLLGDWDPWDPASTESHAEPLDGPLCRAVGELAGELGVWVVPGSILERSDDGRIHNTMVVFAPTGELVAAYRKAFPWRPVETTEPGREFVTVPIEQCTIGLTVCYDAWFPEVSRQLAWMGAELLLNVVLTPTADRAQEVVLVQANAIVNQVFVGSVNAASPRGQGRSLLVDPQGRILAAAVGAEPTVLAATIDLDEVARTRQFGTAGVTRRPWSPFTETDQPIELPVYDGRIDPTTWTPR
ncbi:MAG: carbon-nitrogen hydrolase family protein [Mycobacterium kyogaense]|uniref:carbon-nitrogen hydrolase family protein n=1 Tax=Mycobacterium kyogaense TaxID=2212479 RepID=UPI002FF51D11